MPQSLTDTWHLLHPLCLLPFPSFSSFPYSSLLPFSSPLISFLPLPFPSISLLPFLPPPISPLSLPSSLPSSFLSLLPSSISPLPLPFPLPSSSLLPLLPFSPSSFPSFPSNSRPLPFFPFPFPLQKTPPLFSSPSGCRLPAHYVRSITRVTHTSARENRHLGHIIPDQFSIPDLINTDSGSFSECYIHLLRSPITYYASLNK